MAYQIIGQVHIIGLTEQIQTKTGGVMMKRNLILMQRRYDPSTGEEFTPNFPQLEFSGNACAQLDQFKLGDRVVIKFDVSGTTWNDKRTGEPKYMTRLRAFSIAPYVPQQQAPQAPQPPVQQPAPQQYQQQPPQQPPQGGYQQPQQQYPPQQGGYPPQDPNLPF